MKYFLFIPCLLLFSACKTFDPQIVERYDRLYNSRRIQLSGNDLDDRKFSAIYFDPAITISQTGDTTYFFQIEYVADSWLFIDKERPASLLIDGELYHLPQSFYDASDVQYGGNISEIVRVMTDKQFIHKIASAGEIIFRLNGDKYYREAKFQPRNFTAIQNFCQKARI